MPIKVRSIIDKVFLNIEDPIQERFTRAEVLNEINAVRREFISSFNAPYSRRFSQELVEGQTIYEYPGDLISVTHSYLSLWDKKKLKEAILEDDEPGENDVPAIYKERVSANEYEIIPEITVARIAGNGTGTITRGAVPDSGLVKDVWVDENGIIYRCCSAYTTGTTELTLTSGRTTPLRFLAEDVTAYIEVAINRAGASGTSALSKIGAGTYTSPYVYTFNLYDNNSSNNAIIALLVGDAHLTAEGTSAANVTVTPYGSTPLTQTHRANWAAFAIDMVYKAELPEMYSEEEEMHPSIVNPLRSGDALAMLAAANLMVKLRKDPQTIQAFRQQAFTIIQENQFRVNRKMGLFSMKPGYR